MQKGVLIAVLLMLASLAHAKEARVWIVTLADPPLAAFEGFPEQRGPEKAAMRPTFGRLAADGRLDIDSADARAYLDHLDHETGSLLIQASLRLGRAIEPIHRYRLASSGFSVRLDDDEAKALHALPGVASVEPDQLFELHAAAGAAWIGAPLVWAGLPQASLPGSRGEGVVIGVVDTGIDWFHEAFAAQAADGFLHLNPRGQVFGRCREPALALRCNGKLIGIYDFTDEGLRDGRDPDGHGSHVASTAAGNAFSGMLGGAMLSAVGVAPRAHIISYKACREVEGQGFRCPTSAILAALDQAIADRVDVLNFSIGGALRNPWTALSATANSDHRAFFNLRAANIVGVTSAGNSGPGPGTITSPANAPWVLAVANSSHDRRLESRVIGMTGGADPAPADLSGAALTPSLGVRPIVWGGDFGSALCSTGADLDFPPTGVSNPWVGQRPFNGEIVVCMRGVQARVAKSFNVQLAGGAGMILLNDQADGESVIADPHSIPATHLGFRDGQRLRAWLSTGSAHRGALSGTQSFFDPSFGDRLAASSSRGPARPVGGFLKPDLAAPGTNIVAADYITGQPAIKSGTSMASPHVAGAAALVRALRRQWTVEQVESALLTTASRETMRLADGLSIALGPDVGAGRVRADRAVRAGLYLPLSNTELRNADPALGGNPEALNRPLLYSERCRERCSFIRVVRPLQQGGSWTASVRSRLPVQVTVTPSTFTLVPGQSQVLAIEVDVSHPSLPGAWVDAEIVLQHSAGDAVVADSVLPVSVLADSGPWPSRLALAVDRNEGTRSIELPGLPALAPLRLRSLPPAQASAASATLPQDSFPEDPFRENANGRLLRLVDVPQGVRALVVEAGSDSALEVHLYLGRDNDAGNDADLNELRCSSTRAAARQSCVIDDPAPGRYWLLAQNVRSASVSDSLRLEWALLRDPLAGATAPQLRATAAGRHAGDTTLRLDLHWKLPGLRQGDVVMGLLDLGSAADTPGQYARLPVRVERPQAHGAHLSQALRLGQPVVLTLAPGQAHERLYVDVAGRDAAGRASTLRISSLGTAGDIQIHALRVPVSPDRPLAEPVGLPGSASHQATGTGATRSLALPLDGDGALERWQLHVENSSPVEATIQLTASVEGSISAAPQADAALRPGDYFNPARDGHGINISRAGDQWLLLWYTYDEAEQPVWYVAQAAAPANMGRRWNAPLLRFVWDGGAAWSTEVGEVELWAMGSDELLFGWTLGGVSAAEPMVLLGDRSCRSLAGNDAGLTGHWFASDLPGYGWTPLVMSAFEGHWIYAYDGDWIPRWAYAGTDGALEQAASGTLLQFEGTCPGCVWRASSSRPAGQLQRRYLGPNSAELSLDLQFLAPLRGSWQQARPSVRLSVADSCP